MLKMSGDRLLYVLGVATGIALVESGLVSPVRWIAKMTNITPMMAASLILAMSVIGCLVSRRVALCQHVRRLGLLGEQE